MGTSLSVVLPNFNHARYLPRAISALLSQELRPSEIILVDDASTDDSLAVINRFAAETPLIRVVINSRNLGVNNCLNRGLTLARNRYVYFAAADDWVLSGFFSCAVAILEDHPTAGLACGEARLIDGTSGRPLGIRPPVRPLNRTGLLEPERACAFLARADNWSLTGSTIFRREAVVWAGGFDEQLGSFADGFVARKIALTYGFCFIPRVVATWVIYSNSFSRQTALDVERAQQLLEHIGARLSTDPTFPKWYAGVFANRWRFATSKLALEASPVNYEFLMMMAARSSLDRHIIFMLSRSPWWLPRIFLLAWLWLRFHPTTLVGLILTALARRLSKIRDALKIGKAREELL